MSTLVAPSGKCLWAEGLVWLIGAVVCSLAAVVRLRVQWMAALSAAAPLALADQLPLPMIVKRGWLGFRPCKTRYIRITGFSFSFSTTISK